MLEGAGHIHGGTSAGGEGTTVGVGGAGPNRTRPTTFGSTFLVSLSLLCDGDSMHITSIDATEGRRNAVQVIFSIITLFIKLLLEGKLFNKFDLI